MMKPLLPNGTFLQHYGHHNAPHPLQHQYQHQHPRGHPGHGGHAVHLHPTGYGMMPQAHGARSLQMLQPQELPQFVEENSVVVRNKAEAFELTAVRQVVMKTNYKLGNLQKQFTGLQESMNRIEALVLRLINQAQTLDQTTGRYALNLRPTEEPRALPDLTQPAELDMEMASSVDDLRQINVRSTPEGNFYFPSTGFSVVATGWDLDPLQPEDPRKLPEMVLSGDLEIPEVKDYQPRMVPGKEILEQGVYGIDPYTHNLPKEIMPADLDWSIDDKQVRHLTGFGNTPMVYPLKPVIEEIQKSDLAQLYKVGRANRRLRRLGLLWYLPPWPDLSLCEVYGMAKGMQKEAEAVSKRKAYDVVAGQSKIQFQPTRNKQLTDFVKEWVAMVEQYKLEDNKWFSELCSCRKQWAPGYVNHSFWAGTSAIRKVEKSDPYLDGAVEFGGVRLGQVRNFLGKITYDPKSCAWMSVVNVINLDKRRKHNVTENYLLLLKKFKTKDGVTVAKSIDFQDRVKNIGASLVKQVANATNDTAGDGTTCATVLTKAIFTEGCKSEAAVMNAMDLRRGISMAVDAVVINLKSMARTISTSEGIPQVGSIPANGKVVQRLTRFFREKVSAGHLKLKETDCNDCIVPLANKCIHQEILVDSAATAVNVLSAKAATRSNYIKFAKITPATCSTLSMKQGRGTVEEISTKLRDNCPSCFNESDYKCYLTVENLEKASMTNNHDGRETLARDAFSLLTRIPDSADLSAICKRFENRRFYETVIQLTLQKAHTLDSIADAINGQIDVRPHDTTIAQCEQCYNIVMNALSTLKGVGQSGTQRADQSSGSASALDPTSRSKYSNQLIPLSVQWPDTALHEHLYRTLIEFGLENELLEYGGFDLVAFLQSAGCKLQEVVRGVSVVASKGSKLYDLGAPVSTIQTKYIELLVRYYVLKGEHIAAARLLLILAERQCSNTEETLILDQRYQYLRNAVPQTKGSGIATDSLRNTINTSNAEYLLEGKLSVLQFQMQIKPELEYWAFRLEHIPGSSEFLSDPFPRDSIVADAETAMAAKGRAIKQVPHRWCSVFIRDTLEGGLHSFQWWEVSNNILTGIADESTFLIRFALVLEKVIKLFKTEFLDGCGVTSSMNVLVVEHLVNFTFRPSNPDFHT